MITSIHQPGFFPWLGYLDKVAKSEQFIFLDDVQANKASYQYRNIFYCDGKPMHITLPVDYSSRKKLSELNFRNNLWRADHLNKLRNYYRKAPYFDEIYPLIEEVYNFTCELPVEFIIHTMEFTFKIFNINVKTQRSSAINYVGTKGDLVLDICKKTDTNIYLSGRGAENYMDDVVIDAFTESAIDIKWHNFIHPDYLQFKRHPFVSGLSSLDILFFLGIKDANNVFWSNVHNSNDI